MIKCAISLFFWINNVWINVAPRTRTLGQITSNFTGVISPMFN